MYHQYRFPWDLMSYLRKQTLARSSKNWQWLSLVQTEDANPNNTKNEDQHDNLTKEPKKPTNILAAEAFFSIGNLLSEGNKKEGAIFAYDQAIYLNPEHAHSYYNRGRQISRKP